MKRILFETDEVLELDVATLRGHAMDGAKLHRAIFDKEDMREIRLRGADLRGANLFETDLTDADLQGASLITAFVMSARLHRANLAKCRAMHCRFDGSDLRDASLDGADIRGANFDKADLRGARLSVAEFAGGSFVGAVYDDSTVWPAGLDPVAAGARQSAAPRDN